MLFRILFFALLLNTLLSGCVKIGTSAIQKVSLETLPGQTKEQLIARFGSPYEQLLEYADGRTRETWSWSYLNSTPGLPVLPVNMGVTFNELGIVVSSYRRTALEITKRPPDWP